MIPLYQQVEKVINEWDPIGLFPLFPPNEYEKEISLVCRCMESSASLNEVAECIYQIFTEHFGSNVFEKDKDECKKIASLLFE